MAPNGAAAGRSDSSAGPRAAASLSPTEGLAHPIAIQALDLSKSYMLGGRELLLFSGLDLSVRQGELVAVVGQSGAGKSTLLHLLAALDTPTAGEVLLDGRSIGRLKADRAARLRNTEIGYVWQFHYLLPEFTAEENVAMPLLARGLNKAEALGAARQWLERVGLGDRADHRAGELSGGEQQRVAIARALVTGPKVLLADEPTGDLDGATADAVFALFESLHRAGGLTTIFVTHNLALAGRADRLLRLAHGRLQELEGTEIEVLGA